MLNWKTLNSLACDTCKGTIVAARVYADTPKNTCSCGGLFSKRTPFSEDESTLMPRCNQCDKLPPVYHIDCDATDQNGGKIRVKIRNDQNNNRLTKASQVLFTLERIQQEIKEGNFDINRYSSKDARESFRFKNYILTYIEFQNEKLTKGDITPKGLRDKLGLIKRELMPFFGRFDLAEINHPLISKFQRSYKDKFRTRDLALGELKTILRQAVKDGKLKSAPEFDKIPKAKTRIKVISTELMEKTISMVEVKLYRDILTLMSIYPMRPSEARALKWKDVNLATNKLVVRAHFSDEFLITGRKSIKDGEKAELDFPLTTRAKMIFDDHRPEVPTLDWKEKFIFINRNGNHVTDEALRMAWNNAREKLGHTHTLYEIRHRCLTDFARKVNGDIVKMMRVSGHKNPTTLTDRYIRDDSDMSEYF